MDIERYRDYIAAQLEALVGIDSPSGFASFLYDMTPCLREEGNTVAVRVDHGQEFDSRWYTGSGIYRNVWLVSAPEVHLAQWGTAYRLTAITKSKASVEVDVETTDDGRSKKEEGRSKKEGWNARVELIDRDGKTVASARTAIGSNGKKTVRLTVKNPQRWTLERPYLYTLRTVLLAPKAEDNDTSTVRAGLRTLEFSPDKGFALNGEWMKVKGVCVHDDAGVLGGAAGSGS